MPFLASQGTSIIRTAGEALPAAGSRIEWNSFKSDRISCEAGASYYRDSAREQASRTMFHVKRRKFLTRKTRGRLQPAGCSTWNITKGAA
jgi:hypothetical protein